VILPILPGNKRSFQSSEIKKPIRKDGLFR
jgi:hypothetical protein